MAYRWRPKNAEVDPDSPRAFACCDRCGFLHNHHKLQWQFAYQGSALPQNTRRLVCDRCLDPLNPQDAPYIIPPDPLPVINARPGASSVDEGSWLITDEGEIIATQDGDYIGTAIPNPDDAANASRITLARVDSPGLLSLFASLGIAYLDIFDGEPSAGGSSVLAALTGSATRTNLASSLSLYRSDTRLVNPAAITITSAALTRVNASHAAFYGAPTGGAPLISGPIGLSQTIAEGNPVTVAPLGIDIEVE